MPDRAKYGAWLVESWEQGGLTQAEFYHRRGVKAVTFAWWQRKVRGAAHRPYRWSGRSTGGDAHPKLSQSGRVSRIEF